MLDQENKNFEMLSVTMKEQFDVQITNYDPKDYEVAVSFLEMKNIRHFLMYSVIFVATTCLKKSYWEVYTEKLPILNNPAYTLISTPKSFDQKNIGALFKKKRRV